MAFFDDLGKKLSQTGQEAYSKTKTAAEILKYTSLISNEEKQLSRFYSELGQKYYSYIINQTEIPEEYLQILQCISDSLKTIDDYQNQLKVIKGIKVCTSCGADIPTDEPYCPACGAKAEQNIETEGNDTNALKCKICGTPIQDDDLFCSNCGCKIELSDISGD